MGGPPGDIEYACTFDLPTPRDCSKPGVVCDCDGDASKDNPLCAPNPNDSGKQTLQVRAKAYPGVKNLAIAKGLENQGIVASICPAQVTDATQADYGYKPAVESIVHTLRSRLALAQRGQCLPNALTPDANGQVACVVIEATHSQSCSCDPAAARAPVTADHQCLVDTAKQQPGGAGLDCFCEIEQTSGTASQDCQDNESTQATTSGYCYVGPGDGNPVLVKNCPAGEQQLLRFVGAGEPAPNSVVVVACQ